MPPSSASRYGVLKSDKLSEEPELESKKLCTGSELAPSVNIASRLSDLCTLDIT